MATRRDRKDCSKLSLRLRTWNRSNNSPEQCWELLANNVASVWTGLKVWPVSNFARQLPTTRNRVCKKTQHVTSNIVGICWPTMLRLFARRRTPLVRFREESTFQRVIEKRRLKNSRDQLPNVSGRVIVSDERERERVNCYSKVHVVWRVARLFAISGISNVNGIVCWLSYCSHIGCSTWTSTGSLPSSRGGGICLRC